MKDNLSNNPDLQRKINNHIIIALYRICAKIDPESKLSLRESIDQAYDLMNGKDFKQLRKDFYANS